GTHKLPRNPGRVAVDPMEAPRHRLRRSRCAAPRRVLPPPIAPGGGCLAVVIQLGYHKVSLRWPGRVEAGEAGRLRGPGRGHRLTAHLLGTINGVFRGRRKCRTAWEREPIFPPAGAVGHIPDHLIRDPVFDHGARLMVSDFTWIVIAPGGVTNLPLACEAARAGAWGFVDLEDVRDAEALRDAFSELTSDADVPLGVKLDASRREIWEPLLAAQPRRLTRVILTCPSRSASELRAMVSGLQRLALEVLVEAVSVDEAVAAHQAGADGIIAKGSEAGGRIGDETSFLLLQRLYGLFPTPIYAHGGVGLHTAAACRVAGARG